jgi:hypothetical protein
MAGKPKDIETIFSAALKLESKTERSAYLNDVCGNPSITVGRPLCSSKTSRPC